jgi:hypothetical protein
MINTAAIDFLSAVIDVKSQKDIWKTRAVNWKCVCTFLLLLCINHVVRYISLIPQIKRYLFVSLSFEYYNPNKKNGCVNMGKLIFETQYKVHV